MAAVNLSRVITVACRYHRGLELVIKNGYERYPNLSEVFNVGSGNCSYEWLNLAWEIEGKTLVAYEDPTGLKFHEWIDEKSQACRYGYRTPGFRFKNKRVFNLPKTSAKKRRYPLSEFDDEFVSFHIGRNLDNLTEDIKTNTFVDIPPSEFLVPVSYGNYSNNDRVSFLFGHIGCNGSARGARERR
jgi:hypothetical protein